MYSDSQEWYLDAYVSPDFEENIAEVSREALQKITKGLSLSNRH